MCQVAKMNEFYLTMDDLLNYYYSNNRPNDKENSKRNKLVELLDAGLVFLLFEIFMYIEGPRIRDRVSHSDLNQIEIQDFYVEIIQFISIQLASMSMPKCNELNKLFEFKSFIYNNYEPSFHPICCFQNEIYNLTEKAEKLPGYVEIENKEEEQQHKDLTELKSKLENMIKSQFDSDLVNDFLVTRVKSKWKIKDFFRFVFRYDMETNEYDMKLFKSNESQLIKSLVSIIKQIDIFIASLNERILSISQLNKTQLRERQRNNISYFCSAYQLFKLFLDLTKYFFILFTDLYIISIESSIGISINDFYFNEKSKINFIQILKYLKQYLQLVQNLNSKVLSNKWLECHELIYKNEKFSFISLIKLFVDN
jgi:hypothetical protein